MDLGTLVELVVSSQLIATLSEAGPFTIFAPTDEAFFAAITALTGKNASLETNLVPNLLSPEFVNAVLVCILLCLCFQSVWHVYHTFATNFDYL
jgi:hypothetical protein